MSKIYYNKPEPDTKRKTSVEPKKWEHSRNSKTLRKSDILKTIHELELIQADLEVKNKEVHLALEEANNTIRKLTVKISKRHHEATAMKESETRLKEINATKDKFFSIISHDLRSPFTSIIGFSNLLVEKIRENDFKKAKEYAGIIHDSSWRAMNLLINLIEWSSSHTRKIGYNPEYFDIVDLINEVTELSNDSAKPKSINIIRKLPLVVIAYADRDMISTVLRNLISNAIKYTNPGGEIVISIQQNTRELIVSVSDNGIGILNETIEKLFRIEDNYSTIGTQKETGSGIGLLLCKEFIDKHQGEIWAESEPGKGSKFLFKLPVSR